MCWREEKAVTFTGSTKALAVTPEAPPVFCSPWCGSQSWSWAGAGCGVEQYRLVVLYTKTGLQLFHHPNASATVWAQPQRDCNPETGRCIHSALQQQRDIFACLYYATSCYLAFSLGTLFDLGSWVWITSHTFRFSCTVWMRTSLSNQYASIVGHPDILLIGTRRLSLDVKFYFCQYLCLRFFLFYSKKHLPYRISQKSSSSFAKKDRRIPAQGKKLQILLDTKGYILLSIRPLLYKLIETVNAPLQWQRHLTTVNRVSSSN